MQKLCVIINPWAGRGKAGQRLPELQTALTQAGAEHTVLPTSARGEAIRLAWQAAERGYERVIAVGGDGTINEVVNGLKLAEAALGHRAQLGVIPLGTGSDFIKMLDGVVPNDLEGGVQRAIGSRTRSVDLGRAQVGDAVPRFFANQISMGFDAQVAAESLKLTRLKGFTVYVVAVLRALAQYRVHPMAVEYDGNQVRRRLLFASIANGRCQGGGFWLTPAALIDDGMLDLCLVDQLRIDQIIRYMPKVMKGTHVGLKQVMIQRVKNITVTCAEGMPVATDGEVLATDARQVSIAVLPNAIEILV